MDRTFWLEKWAQHQIGFHQPQVHPDLIAQASFLAGGPHRVLVPLCGKTLDLHWLAEQGHATTGIELSDIAAREFHEEQQRTPTRSVSGPYTVLSSPNLRYLLGDIMHLEGTFDRVWDRRALEQRRPQPRALSLDVLDIHWGTLRLRAAGDLTVDDSGLPSGTLTVKAENWRELLKMAGQAGRLPRDALRGAERVLGMLAGLGGNPEDLETQVNIRDGWMALGPLPLGPAPRLILR